MRPSQARSTAPPGCCSRPPAAEAASCQRQRSTPSRLLRDISIGSCETWMIAVRCHHDRRHILVGNRVGVQVGGPSESLALAISPDLRTSLCAKAIIGMKSSCFLSTAAHHARPKQRPSTGAITSSAIKASSARCAIPGPDGVRTGQRHGHRRTARACRGMRRPPPSFACPAGKSVSKKADGESNWVTIIPEQSGRSECMVKRLRKRESEEDM